MGLTIVDEPGATDVNGVQLLTDDSSIMLVDSTGRKSALVDFDDIAVLRVGNVLYAATGDDIDATDDPSDGMIAGMTVYRLEKIQAEIVQTVFDTGETDDETNTDGEESNDDDEDNDMDDEADEDNNDTDEDDE